MEEWRFKLAMWLYAFAAIALISFLAIVYIPRSPFGLFGQGNWLLFFFIWFPIVFFGLVASATLILISSRSGS